MKDAALLLALDTSSEIGSVAVARGDAVLGSRWLLRKGEHATALIPQIAAALVSAGVDRGDLDGLVVGHGPGSFTGLRIAAATARGLAKGLCLPLWHHSSLAAAAASLDVDPPKPLGHGEGSGPDAVRQVAARGPCYVLFDARADRVYGACYRLSSDRIETVVGPAASTLSEVLKTEIHENTWFCGDGALRHAEALVDAGHPVFPFPAGLPTAEGLLRVHCLSDGGAAVEDGARWEPEYLRSPSAWTPSQTQS